MELNSTNNYFPSYECGECVPHLAYMYDAIKHNDLVNTACCNCDLYSRNIKVISENLYTYRNIFIEKVDLASRIVSGYGFRVKNRETIHFHILSACDEIDREICDV